MIVPRVDEGDIVVHVQKAGGEILTDGVVVRVSSTNQADDLDEGELRVGPCEPGQFIVAWAPGYKTARYPCDGQTKNYSIILEPLNTTDNPVYAWLSAGDLNSGCGGCHSMQRGQKSNEFQEWQSSGHAKVFRNRFFETIYMGTNLSGNRSSTTIWDLIDDHLVQRAPPEGSGCCGPGFKLDYPYQYGNCAYCHAPAAVGPTMTEVDLVPYFPNPGGAIGEGITCDICHKVIGLHLDENGYPFRERPGLLTFQYMRPLDGSDFFIGPLINYTTPNSPGHTSTCSSVYADSAFCAACHYGIFSNTMIYGSYKEWRESDYGRDPASDAYRTCQDCHMRAENLPVPEDPSERQICSISNIENRDYNHNMMDFGPNSSGQNIPRMIENAATIDADIDYNPSKKNLLLITARVKSEGVGHRFPTDSPLRHLILVIEVRDERGTLLDQVDGGSLPSWAGKGEPFPDWPLVQPYEGLPGTIFANLLMEKDTSISPTTAYWNETRLAWVGDLTADPMDHSDTRLLPNKEHWSQYSFEVPERGDIRVTIRLIYRFAFYDLMRQKGWYRPDIEVASRVWDCKRSQDRTSFTCSERLKE